jgi:hypothetical protein
MTDSTATGFALTGDYKPAGDQPQAIAGLVEGLQSGLTHQTLLGVTGSGKSIGYDDPLYIVEGVNGEFRTRIVRAGPFIDGLIESAADLAQAGETERYSTLPAAYYAHAYDPVRGVAGRFPVAAFLRHRAPARMFRLTTTCGRAATLTGDHNLWVLRGGRLNLVRTEEVRPTDYMPTPDAIPAHEDVRVLDVLPYLMDTDLSVFAESAVMACAAAGGYSSIVASFRESGLAPYAKLSAIRHETHGSGIKVRDYVRLAQRTNNLAGYSTADSIHVGGKRRACRLPAQLPLTDSVLALFGYYIAEGCAQDQYFILANRHPIIRAQIETALRELGIPFGVRPTSDYQISSTALTTLLAKTCGSTAWVKRLPDFWTRLSNHSLGVLLRAYFDGDGTVGRNGEVSATTAPAQRLCRWIAFLGGEVAGIVKRNAARADGTPAGDIDCPMSGDAEQPGAGIPTAGDVGVGASPDRQKRILHHILGSLDRAKDAVGHAEGRPSVPLVEQVERCEIALGDADQQRFVGRLN